MKVTTIVRFVLVLMACRAHVIICSNLYGNKTDRLSLLEFKMAISLNPQQALMSWNDSAHFCHWEGVLCRMKTPRRVTSLNLTNRGLIGQISPSLGNLTFLKFLFLPTNSFTGEIPPSLGHLHHLESLYLSKNTLQGSTPDFANCSRLNIIEIHHNHLVGQIPGQINLPPLLQQLQLSFNNLTGTIPSSFANITTLDKLSIVFNSIEGNVPYEIGKLSKVRYLYLGSNKLSGTFQPTLQNLSSLVGLNLAFNNLYGELPSTFGASLPNLQYLTLANNSFEGHIPYSVVNASNLYLLDITNNKLSGVIPSSIGKLKKLHNLNLHWNQLQARDKQQWEFMDSLSNCTELYSLSLTGNRLEGQIPNSLGNLSTKLQSLFLGHNQLSGNFPSGIAHLLTLSSLGLDGNHFTGAFPEWLGTLKELQAIDISDNIFTGSIPASLSNLSLLSLLYLNSNRFEGHIPSGLGNIRVLEVLDMSNNNIYGIIPKEICKIPTIWQLWLSFNNLDGPLPVEIGNAKQLMSLHLSSNKLYGDIPDTLGNCESLVDIKLGRNVFSGSIPTSLGNITSLEALDLSHNNLTGTIPASLGNLQLLQLLDLSFNHLKGEVPTKGIFKYATAIQIDGNQALCGGPPELHLLVCSIMPWNSTKHKQSSIVLKVVTPLASMVLLAIVIFFLFLWRGKQKRKSISLPSFDSKFPKVSYNDIAKATDGFSTSKLIGRGRYGSVYQGALFQDRNAIAIKVFSLETRGAQKSFIAECNALRNVRHRNLVPILTACSSIDAKGNDFKALVYEFMPRGDLHALLYSTRDDENTSTSNHIALAQRLSIVVDVADALEYLHHNNHGTIVHCDLKPRNILLDDNMTAHVGDFGLARFKVDSTTSSYLGDSNSTSSLAIKGTIGYVAPECAGGNQVSSASDVYSFGVVLLEIFIRKRPTDDMFKDGLSIAKFTEMNFPDKILQITDPQLRQELVLCQDTTRARKEKGVECLLSMLNVGLCCTKTSPSERIRMQEVAAKLHGIRDACLRGTEEIVQRLQQF